MMQTVPAVRDCLALQNYETLTCEIVLLCNTCNPITVNIGFTTELNSSKIAELIKTELID